MVVTRQRELRYSAMLNLVDRRTTVFSNGQALLQHTYRPNGNPANTEAGNATCASAPATPVRIDIPVSPLTIRSSVVAMWKSNDHLKHLLETNVQLMSDTAREAQSLSTMTDPALWIGQNVELRAAGECVEGRLMFIERLQGAQLQWYAVLMPTHKSGPALYTNVDAIRVLNSSATLPCPTNQVSLHISPHKFKPHNGGTNPRRFAELSYLTNGVTWRSSTALYLNSTTTFVMAGIARATIHNSTNFEISGTALRLVVGEPNRAQDLDSGTPRPQEMLQASFARSEPATTSQEQQYYVLTVPGQDHRLAPWGQLQTTLFELDRVPVRPFHRYPLTPDPSVFGGNPPNGTSVVVPHKSDWGIQLSTDTQVWPPGEVTVYQESNPDAEQEPVGCRTGNIREIRYPNYAGFTSLARAAPPDTALELTLGKSEILTGQHQLTVEDVVASNTETGLPVPGYTRRIEVQGELLVTENVAPHADLYVSYAEAPNARVRQSVAEISVRGTGNTNGRRNAGTVYLEFGGWHNGVLRWYIRNWKAPAQLAFRLVFQVSTQVAVAQVASANGSGGIARPSALVEL